jgi:hypothetical protein
MDRMFTSDVGSFASPLRDRATEFETNRSDPGYIRWIQQSLNQILGLRLAVDGIMGPQTRSAVRSFQQRQGLTADGIVGPLTERALQAAIPSVPRPGQPSGTPVAPRQPVSVPSNGALQHLRDAIVRVATEEWIRWGRGTVNEREPSIHGVLQDYWRTGAGTQLTEPGWWSTYPWSAAFISWVLRKAGAGDRFRYSAEHAAYISAAKQNRLTNSSNPIKAYRITEVPPRRGDLVCKSRAGSGATYDNIRPGMATHCDIVTELQPGRAITIGGNVSDSVKETPVRTNAAGYVVQQGYFAVIRVG